MQQNGADDTLRLELGCRPFASWFSQRKLEYAYRLLQQDTCRLPRQVSEVCWPTKRKSGPGFTPSWWQN